MVEPAARSKATGAVPAFASPTRVTSGKPATARQPTPAPKVRSNREVTIANHYPRLKFDRRGVVRMIATLEANLSILRISGTAIPPGELSLVFLTDHALAQLHDEFLQDPSPTDVVTFEGNAVHGVAGEICVSVDAAIRETRSAPKSDPRLPSRKPSSRAGRGFSEELTLYLVHGWLHLAGYDDLVPRKKRLMRQAEARAMKLLRDHRAIPRLVCPNLGKLARPTGVTPPPRDVPEARGNLAGKRLRRLTTRVPRVPR
ncbi:MAG: hypothetical protein RIQ93_1375 [Verrucomicrobiota bacterium]|jgi:probable rRNA maturation factor